MGVMVREYRSTDASVLAKLFYETIHTVNARDYTSAQLDAWAPHPPVPAPFDRALCAGRTVVAVEGDQPVGFASMDEGGYLDYLYVSKDCQGRGIATALCDALEAACPAPSFSTKASITARPFFERRGYRVVEHERVERNGVLLDRFAMEK